MLSGVLKRAWMVVVLAVLAALLPAGVPAFAASPPGRQVQPRGDGNWQPGQVTQPPALQVKKRAPRAVPVAKNDPHAKRVKELTGRRTANASFYQMSDGSIQADVSAGPVHYRDASGAWQDINTAVKPVQHGKFTYGATGNSFGTYFSADASDLVSLEDGAAQVQVGAAGAVTKSPAVAGNAVTYHDAYPGTDLRYQAGPGGVKESVVLARAPKAGASYTFTVRVSAGLAPRMLAGGAVGLYGTESADPVYVIPAPYMADSHPDVNSPYGVSYSAKVAQSATWDAASRTVTLTLTPDAGWLAAKGRQYPVTIDPTIVVAPTPSDASNVMVLADGATTNYVNSYRLSVGTTTTGAARALIKFPLPATLPGAAAGTTPTITSAHMRLYYDQVFTTGANTVPMEAMPVTAAWNPATVTWKTQPAANTTAAGTSQMVANELATWVDFPITPSVVQGWAASPSTNNGLQVRATAETPLGKGGPRFEASFYAYGGETVNYPQLVLTYGVVGVTVNPPTVIHSTGAELSWPAYVNSTGNAANDLAEYQVHRTVFQSFTPSSYTLIAPVKAGTTTFTDTSAPPTPANASDPYGNAYYYMVAVKTKGGTVIPGPTVLVRLPEAGRTTLIIPASGTTTLSSLTPTTALNGGINNAGTVQHWVEVGDDSPSYGITHAVMQFPALPASIPAGSTVMDAHLKMWQETVTTGTTGAVYEVHGLTKAFNSAQATWNSAATGTAWAKAGGDYSATATGTVSALTNDPGRDDLTVTPIVQGWLNTPASNDGLLVKLANEATTGPQEHTVFAANGTSEAALAPELVVTYLDSQQTYYAPSTPSDMSPGTTYTVPVTINNTTAATWAAASEVLTYHWLLPDGTDVTTKATQLQTAIPADMAPAATATLSAQVTPPPALDGNLAEGATLVWDMYNKTTGVYLSGRSGPVSVAPAALVGGALAGAVPAGIAAPAAAGNGAGSLAQQVSVDSSGNNQLGLNSFYSYTTVPSGAGSTVNANAASGDVVWNDALLANPSRGFTTTLGLSYNSLSTMDTGTGYGWTVDASTSVRLGQALQFHPQASPTSMVMVDATGNAHQWNLVNGTWQSPPGVHLYLQQVATCTPQTDNIVAWKMTAPDRTVVSYDC
ncbi:MAG: repeat-containing protein, partial [Actinomycetia bacterium]|nr:repeat-containing protein [Actinomycetes bacterium]